MFSLFGKSNGDMGIITNVSSTKGTFIKALKKYVSNNTNKKLALIVDWTVYKTLSTSFKAKSSIIVYSKDIDWCEDVWQCGDSFTFNKYFSMMYDQFVIVGGSKFMKKVMSDLNVIDTPEIVMVSGQKHQSSKGWNVLDHGEYYKDVGFSDDENVHVFLK